MASKAFNAVDGVSVGVDTQINVIDSGGNVTAQTLTVSTTANLGSVDNLVITGGESGQFLQTDGNGNLIFADPAGSVSGSNTQIQFNDNDAFGASANLTFDKSTSTLVVKNSINIGGTDSNISGANNVTANFYFGDGGFLSNIASVTANSISNGSSNVKVYNDSNVAISVAGTSNVVDVTSTGANVTGYVTATGNITATYFLGDGGLLSNISGAGTPNSISNGTSNIVVDANSNVRTSVSGTSNVFVVTSTGADLAGNLSITSGNISGVNVVAATTLTATSANIGGGTGGNLTGANIISANTLNAALGANLGNLVTANFFSGNASLLTSLTAANVVGTVANANYSAFAGTVTDNAQPNITSLGTLASLEVNGTANLGQVANVKILGGSNLQVLSTDGTGNLSWVPAGSGSPGGTNTQIQFNDESAFGGSSAFVFDKTSNVVTLSGNISANYFLGDGSLLTGIATGTPNAIVNGTSNVQVDANSNVRVSVAGTSNVFVVTSTGADLVGNLAITTGNVTGANSISANSLVANSANIGGGTGGNLTGANVISANTLIATSANIGGGTGGNLTGANIISANILLAASSANLGNSVTANYFLGNGALLTGIATGTPNAIVNGSSNVQVDANSNVRVSIAGTANVATFATTGLTIDGSLAATEKSFVIKHPTQEGMKLRYGSLESPYHGVRLTGQGEVVNGKAEILLPDYISALVKEEGLNIQLTNIKHDKNLWIEEVNLAKNMFVVGGPTSLFNKTFKFYWSFTAIRKDVPNLITEYKE